MKRALVFLVLVGLVAAPLLRAGDDGPPPLFKGLQMQYTALSWTDFAMTSWALKTGNYAEANPIAKFYVGKPALAMVLLAASDLYVHVGLTHLWKDHRTAAWIVLIAFNVARGYVMYHNLKIAHG